MRFTIKSSKVEMITPAKAKRMLTKNVCNRKLRQSHVDYLIALLKDGEFDTTHQGIAFDAAGNLVDGQHRLEAISQSGIGVKMAVAHYGQVASKPMELSAIDGGVSRTIADVLNVSHSRVAIARALVQLMENGDFSSRRNERVSPEKVARVLELLGDKDSVLTTTSRRGRTNALVRVAVLARCLLSPDHSVDIAGQYEHWLADDRQKLWPAVDALEKRVVRSFEQNTRIANRELALLAFSAFNPKVSQRRRGRLNLGGVNGDLTLEIAEAYAFLTPALKSAK